MPAVPARAAENRPMPPVHVMAGAAPAHGSARTRFRSIAVLVAVLCALVLCAAASGAVSIPLARVPALLFASALEAEEVLWRNVLLEVRLPRVLFAVVVGAGLAIAGAAMQALFRNPLAEPGLIGVSLGGSLGAVSAIVLLSSNLAIVAPSAFVGSLAATALAYRLGSRQPGVAGVLLAGIAINAICASLIGWLSFRADDTQLRNLTFWNLGSLAGATWPLLAGTAPWVALLSWLLMRNWRAMNALLLGEREAQHLGFALRQLRRRLIVLAALLVGPLVSLTGTIGFVGLVVPHLVRLSLGADHRLLLPATVVGGGIALTLADWLSRVAVIPSELPIGIVTSLVGGPFLLWLLSRRTA